MLTDVTMIKKFYTKLSFSLAGCLLTYLICQTQMITPEATFTTYYRNMTNITTTVPFNEKSGTYDIPIDTPFNITCVYTNAVTSIAEGQVEWKAGPVEHTEYIYKNENLRTGFNLAPVSIPKDGPTNGSLSLMENKAFPRDYANSDSPRLRYECFLLLISGGQGGEYNQTYMVQFLDLSVIDPVQILRVTENTTVNEGEDLELQCETSGLPKAEIEWTKTDGKVFPATLGGGLIHKSMNSKLMLSNITAESSATYQCSASNRVTYPAVTQTVTVIVRHKPIVSAHTLAVNQMPGYHTELRCSSEQSIPPLQNVKWHYKPVKHSSEIDQQGDSVEISNDDDKERYQYINSSGDSATLKTTLTIKAVQKEDYQRLFCCVYTNVIGESETCISVKKSDKPVNVYGQKPRKAKVNDSSILSAHVVCVVLSSMIAIILYIG